MNFRDEKKKRCYEFLCFLDREMKVDPTFQKTITHVAWTDCRPVTTTAQPTKSR
jgi:hypothetical protein